jgi:hypothetical protein
MLCVEWVNLAKLLRPSNSRNGIGGPSAFASDQVSLPIWIEFDQESPHASDLVNNRGSIFIFLSDDDEHNQENRMETAVLDQSTEFLGFSAGSNRFSNPLRRAPFIET